MKKILIVAFLVLVLASTGLYFHFSGGDGISVKVTAVEPGEMSSTLTATGKVVSREEADISSSAAARVKAVYVSEGQHVAAGALLALLEDGEQGEMVRKAEESLREAREKVRRQERNCRALEKIFSAGGVSRQSADDAKSELEMARAEAGRASAELSAARAALEKLKVRASFAGTITLKKINPGEWALPGTPIFSLSRENLREVEVMVDESDAGLVRNGQRVELTCDAFPGRVWTERIVNVAPAVKKEGATNSIKVRMSCGPGAPDLKLGQQVDAKILIAERSGTLKLPFDSIINSGGKTCVAVVRDGRIKLIPVVTGIENTVFVEIVKGLSAREEVVLPEGKSFKGGERVSSISREYRKP